MSQTRHKYIDLKVNGRLFPSWILTNFKKYNLPPIILNETDAGFTDVCNPKDDQINGQATLELRKYQTFLSSYLDFKSPYHTMLIYHGLGSGKTASMINIYNMLYNYTAGWNVFVLLPATLKEDPWMKDIKTWLSKDNYQDRLNNIRFISFDSPIADKQFMEEVKKSDISKKSIYIIEEAHMFISNVYSNINTREGRRAQNIYDYIIQDKKDNNDTRIYLLSGTPVVNNPFELALMFNLLRPGTFPKSESQFNSMFLSPGIYKTLHPATKNMFQRRILGLVSYYIGSTPDQFATMKTHFQNIKMSSYQTDIYKYFEDLENKMSLKAKNSGGQSKKKGETYKSYTRQASNFVFPTVDKISGEDRPRPNKFKITVREAEKLQELGEIKMKKSIGTSKSIDSGMLVYYEQYLKVLNQYIDTFTNYIKDINKEDLMKDYNNYKKYNSFDEYISGEKKSKSFDILYNCSSKYVAAIFNILSSPGPVLVYSNYVLMEGLQVFKLFLECFGINKYNKNTNSYIEYHGEISKDQRASNVKIFNNIDNIKGQIIKVIMISPAGAQGLNLVNVRQVHILEPYWHETRITQMIGRARRLCSHKDLPIAERHIDVYRYKSVRDQDQDQKSTETTDQFIEGLARGKQNMLDSFTDAIKEAAVDCSLFKNVNMLTQQYKCFQFNESSLLNDQPGPAFKEDFEDDIHMDNGSNALNSMTVQIKVKKVECVIKTSESGSFSDPKFYWLNEESHVVYDFEMLYAIGKISVIEDIPDKTNKGYYIIDKLINIMVI